MTDIPAPLTPPSTARTILLGLGLTMLVAGLAIGLLPPTFAGTSCGTPWFGSRTANVADLTRAIDADAAGVELPDVGSIADGCAVVRRQPRLVSMLLLIGAAGALITRHNLPRS